MPIAIKQEKLAPTEREKDVLKVIRNSRKDYDGYTPTYRQISDALNLSSATSAAVAVRGLIAKGLLRRGPGRHLVPTEEGK